MFTGISGSYTVRQPSTTVSYSEWSVEEGGIKGVPSIGFEASDINHTYIILSKVISN